MFYAAQAINFSGGVLLCVTQVKFLHSAGRIIFLFATAIVHFFKNTYMILKNFSTAKNF